MFIANYMNGIDLLGSLKERLFASLFLVPFSHVYIHTYTDVNDSRKIENVNKPPKNQFNVHNCIVLSET